jgi:hypothetical protein
MCRCTFDGLHDLRNADWPIRIGKGSQNQMYMIWHDYQPVQAERSTVSCEACINHNLVYWFRQNPSPVSRESDEEYFVAGLVVR